MGGGNPSPNPHNRHLHQAWAPRSLVEEYHHLVFATATAAVKDALRKWEGRLRERRLRALAAAGKAAMMGRVGSASRRPGAPGALGKGGAGGGGVREDPAQQGACVVSVGRFVCLGCVCFFLGGGLLVVGG